MFVVVSEALNVVSCGKSKVYCMVDAVTLKVSVVAADANAVIDVKNSKGRIM